jgi:ubiquinone/menaquinone biosynthesis C-methylase UbiE
LGNNLVKRRVWTSDENEWEQICRNYLLNELGWKLGKPRPILVEYVAKKLVRKGKTLDLCCGAGTNTVYLAQNGFDVTGIDISLTAVAYAKAKAAQANVKIRFFVQNFLKLPFNNEGFDFVHDMGSFHHVKPEDRQTFIQGVDRVLKAGGTHMLTAFSYKNGLGWNHFTKPRLVALFSSYFGLGAFRHYSSVEGDGVTRYFYTVPMKRKVNAGFPTSC